MVDVLGYDAARLLSGRICIDFGAGYVPMDAISMWLLGARSVVAVDYNNIANLRAMHLGLARADFTIVCDLLREIEPDCDWNARVQILKNIAASRTGISFDEIPFSYIAPLDVIANAEGLPIFDFIWSISVLEHIAPSKLIQILNSIKGRASPGALSVHRVDLRDHRDFDGAPYGFLDPNSPFDPEVQADSRGNAMTLEIWQSKLANHPELGLRVAAADGGRPNLVPNDPATGAPVISKVADYITIASSNLGQLSPDDQSSGDPPAP
ncbi:hypothetical protein ABQE93_10345 [Mycolicibacterium sp. XJ662]